MDVSAAPLIGRAEEVSVLDHALDDLARGHWVTLDVVGEPGIGKTRLLEELKTRADRRGALALSGFASELERDLPFWMFVNALDDYVRSLDPHLLDLLEDEVLTELAQVFPALTSSTTSKAAAVVHERYRTHRAVRELLERLTATGPLVLVLDDLHWADPASVELLGSLLRRPPEAAVLLALGRRPDQGSPRVRALLDHAHGGEVAGRISLGALSRSEAEGLIAGSVDRADFASLYQESGGNPFYLEQLVRSLDRRIDGSAVLQELTLDLDVPPAVAASLAEELSLVSTDSHTVLRGAAVVGDPFEPEMAAAAAGATEAMAIAAIDELMGVGLVRQTDVPRRFGFRHPLVRRAVYQTTPPGWRLRAHERTAAALAARGASAATRAHHVERFAKKADQASIATLCEAGNATAHRAPETAARWFDAALRLLRDDAPHEERVELLLSRAAVLASCGRFEEGYANLSQCLELVPLEAVPLRVRLTTACAGMEHLLGRHEMAHQRLASALDGLEDAAAAEAVALMVELAMDGVYRMDFAPVAEQAGRALAVARVSGDRPLTASAAAARAWGAALDGQVPVAQEYRLEASSLVDQLSDGELALRLDAAVNLAGAELYLDQFTAAGSHAERAITVARATGQPAFVPFGFMILAWVQMLHSELADGAVTLDEAIEESRLLGNVQSLAGVLLNRSLIALCAGDLKLAVTAAREAVQLTEEMDAGLIPAATTLALAAALLETGDPALGEAVDLMIHRCGGPGLPFMPGGSFRAKWLELLTRCFIALDRRDDAGRAAARAQALVDPLGGLRMATAMAERAAAIVAMDRGAVQEAARRSLASAAAADEVGIPLEAALSRTLAGRALACAGRTDLAIVELERAATALHASGAWRYRDAAEMELRRLGRHVQRRGASGATGRVGVQSLTHREREVADLVVDRRTNPEIAQALFLSPKTVETHLSHIFHKLEVSSRVEVARAVEAAEPTPGHARTRPT